MAGSAQAEALAQTKLPILEMHCDRSVCGLFSLSLHGQAPCPPSELQGVDVQHRERDGNEKVLLLQTSGTRCDPRPHPVARRDICVIVPYFDV